MYFKKAVTTSTRLSVLHTYYEAVSAQENSIRRDFCPSYSSFTLFTCLVALTMPSVPALGRAKAGTPQLQQIKLKQVESTVCNHSREPRALYTFLVTAAKAVVSM